MHTVRNLIFLFIYLFICVNAYHGINQTLEMSGFLLLFYLKKWHGYSLFSIYFSILKYTKKL